MRDSKSFKSIISENSFNITYYFKRIFRNSTEKQQQQRYSELINNNNAMIESVR